MKNFASRYLAVNSGNIIMNAYGAGKRLLSYQRPLQYTRAEKISNEWNEVLANEPKLSYRDGKYYCFDGQHTIAARKIKNGGQDLDIRCKVYYGMTYEDEAILFAHQNDNGKKVNIQDTVRALYEGGDYDVRNLFHITNDVLGIEMTFTTNDKDNKVNCYDTVLHIYKKYGAAKYMQIMRLIRDTWGGVYPSYNSKIVRGVTEFYTKYEGKLSRQNFIKKLSAVHPVVLMRNADMRIGSRHKVCDEICEVYNKRLQNKIDNGAE